MSKTPLRGPGRFQWSTAGWFGSLAGGLVLVLLLGIIYTGVDQRVAAILLATVGVALAVGVALWRQRDRLLPHPAVQLLVLLCGLAFAVALVTLDAFGYMGERRIYVVLLFFPVMMLRHWLQERHALETARPNPPASSPMDSEPDQPPSSADQPKTTEPDRPAE